MISKIEKEKRVFESNDTLSQSDEGTVEIYKLKITNAIASGEGVENV